MTNDNVGGQYYASTTTSNTLTSPLAVGGTTNCVSGYWPNTYTYAYDWQHASRIAALEAQVKTLTDLLAAVIADRAAPKPRATRKHAGK